MHTTTPATDLSSGDDTTVVYNLSTQNNTGAGVSSLGTDLRLVKAVIAEATEFQAMTADIDRYVYSHDHDGTAGNHLITSDGGTIRSATDQRHTASGIAWKFNPTSTTRGDGYPLVLPVGKVVCTSGVAVSVTVWTRRDSTNIKGQLRVRGGKVAGVLDTSVACEPSVNTWTQSSALAFTPTEDGIVDLEFIVWDGVGTTNSYWIDDLAAS
jgi:hypothetical protein